jgi:DNA-binding IclR family transcriptional regulator
MPLHIGAGPKVILAHLPDEEIDRIIKVRGLPAWTLNSITNASLLKKVVAEVREKGYALSFEDATEGIAAIGCPVRNWTGEVIAAISISGFSRHFNKNQIKKLIRIVVDAARELSSKLGFPAQRR